MPADFFADYKTKLTKTLLQAWYQGAAWAWCLWPLSILYRAMFYAVRLVAKPVPRNAVPVLVVGNITVGGTGKTPLVQALVTSLQQRQLRVGIISRGYGRQDSHTNLLVDNTSTVAMVGDEPLLLHNSCNVPVAVSRDRQAAIALLLKKHALDLIISDDGLQNTQLKGDIEWVVIDGQRGLGNGHCLPMGPLRESASRLQSVDGVWINGSGMGSESDRQAIKIWAKDVPVFSLNPSLGSLHQLHDHQEIAWPANDQMISAMAGIGNPQRFFNDLNDLGYILDTYVFADHHMYTAEDLQPLLDKLLIMTAKDAVKCQHLLQQHQLSWCYAKQSVEIPVAAIEQLLLALKKHQTQDPHEQKIT